MADSTTLEGVGVSEHAGSEGSLPNAWHDLRWMGLHALGLTALTIGIVVLAIAGAAIAPDTLPASAPTVFAIAGGIAALVAIVAFPIAVVTLLRSGGQRQLVASLLVLALGVALVLFVGAAELIDAARDLRTTHSLIGLLAIVLIVGGLLASRGGFNRLLRSFVLDEAISRRFGVLLRGATYAALVVGIFVPFLPLWLSAVTPRHCATWTAALAATAFSIPPFMASWVIWALDRSIVKSLALVQQCPHCGYPRPPGSRCPECGHDATPTSV